MVMVPLLFTTYGIHPPAMHRFVGYLEETACKTYINVIHHVETPGTHLHAEWAKLDAPPMAKVDSFLASQLVRHIIVQPNPNETCNNLILTLLFYVHLPL